MATKTINCNNESKNKRSKNKPEIVTKIPIGGFAYLILPKDDPRVYIKSRRKS